MHTQSDHLIPSLTMVGKIKPMRACAAEHWYSSTSIPTSDDLIEHKKVIADEPVDVLLARAEQLMSILVCDLEHPGGKQISWMLADIFETIGDVI